MFWSNTAVKVLQELIGFTHHEIFCVIHHFGVNQLILISIKWQDW